MKGRGDVLHTPSLAACLAVLWLLLSGHGEPLLLGLGLTSVALSVYIAHRMDVIDHEGHPIHLGWRAPLYWLWLLWEIIKSNIDIARAILHPKMPIAPSVFDVEASQKTEIGQVVYANSITLTPGTVTIAMAGNKLTIHALTQGSRDGLLTGDMDRRVSRVENMDSAKVDPA
jgi:multicomponent Na+:H+ antiporter subunit E